MSTISEIERMPASLSRAIIHAGVGRRPSTARTTRVTNTLAPTRPRMGAVSSIVTEKPLACSVLVGTASAGSRNAEPVACEYSRAMPRIENA